MYPVTSFSKNLDSKQVAGDHHVPSRLFHLGTFPTNFYNIHVDYEAVKGVQVTLRSRDQGKVRAARLEAPFALSRWQAACFERRRQLTGVREKIMKLYKIEEK